MEMDMKSWRDIINKRDLLQQPMDQPLLPCNEVDLQ